MTHDDPAERQFADLVLSGLGDMPQLMRATRWEETPLGPVTQWSQSWRTAVSICLTSRHPVVLWLGKDLRLVYNDAWQRPALGTQKHPWALGRPGREVFAEVWDIIGPMLEGVLATGEATWRDDQLLLLYRYGFLEETYWTYSYSPIKSEHGDVTGVFTAVNETTARVLGERRLRLLKDFGAQASSLQSTTEAIQRAVSTLADDQADLPFTLLYLLDASGSRLTLAGHVAATPDSPAAPQVIEIGVEQERGWPVADVLKTGQAAIVDIPQEYGAIPTGPWKQSPTRAALLPLHAPGHQQLAGILLAGLNPHLRLDHDYEAFLTMLAGHLATTIANARAYEEERRRAEALAELDRAKTVFFTNVSHEFRTPLTLMLGPLEELLDDETLGDAHLQRLKLMHRNGLRLLKLVNTLLDFSRLEAGRIEASYEPVDLGVFTADLASVFRSAIEKAGMRLIVDCPSLPEPAYVDRDMWEKIVLNLLSNAFKFTLNGMIHVTLRSVGTSVTLTVRDTGTGIPADELPYLFQRFHRVKGAKGRTQEGTGIGLALVQELVRLHGGTVAAESVLGQGSTFTVSIPLGTGHLPVGRIGAARSQASTALGAAPFIETALRWLPEEPVRIDEVASEQADRPERHGRADRGARPTGRVLLADDNADMREYVSRLLRERYEVEAVTNGQEALEVLLQHPPDLVLTDVMMPQLDGFGLLHAIRADPRTQKIPVILLSARAGEEALVEGLEHRADDYLVKPFSARELTARVATHLELARVRAEFARREQAALEAREQAQAQLQEVLNTITDGFVVVDTEWRYTYLNERATHLLRRSDEELLGRRIWEAFPEAASTVAYQELRRAMHEKIPVHFELYFPPLGLWFESDGYPSKDGLSIFFRDVTAKKEAERQIQRLNEELTVKVREYETLTRELERSRADLQERNADLEKFHDVVVDRELKMIELEKELAELKTKLSVKRES